MSQQPKGSQRKPLSKRERIIRTGAIVIVLAMVMSLLAGALSFSPGSEISPASAAVAKFVQTDTGGEISVDTDGDGIENNNDEDVDGDGTVNGEDSDIDGDGIKNFDDADPVGVLGIDSNGPVKPIRPGGAGDTLAGSAPWIIGASLVAVFAAISALLLARRRQK